MSTTTTPDVQAASGDCQAAAYAARVDPQQRETMLAMLERQRPGWSLEQYFYRDPGVFEAERKLWFNRQWMTVGHASEIPKVGDRIVRRLFDEEILVVRHGEGPEDIRAFFNVCTHRGSRLCTGDGSGRLIVCPYHAWSFRPTGELQSRRELPEGVDPDTMGLRPVGLVQVAGVLMCALDPQQAPDPRPMVEALEPMLRHQGVDRGRIVARRHYPTGANWKLVLENFFECYHCVPAHPEYTSVNGHVQVSGRRDERSAQQWDEEFSRWQQQVDGSPFRQSVWESGGLERMSHGVHQKPIGGGRMSLTEDGKPVSTLMGDQQAFDGTEAGFRLGRLSFVGAANDYATMFQIIPRGPLETEVVITWLVADDAPADVDPDRIAWMWHVTTLQDKRITELNAAGVSSSAYRPGPYTALEDQTDAFVQSYVQEMTQLLGGGSGEPQAAGWSAPRIGRYEDAANADASPA